MEPACCVRRAGKAAMVAVLIVARCAVSTVLPSSALGQSGAATEEAVLTVVIVTARKVEEKTWSAPPAAKRTPPASRPA